MAAAAANNRSCALSLSFLFVIVFMTALATAPAVVRKEYQCEEIYIVGEGETLQTISEKCSAPFILFDNPHIEDTDDIYEALVKARPVVKKEYQCDEIYIVREGETLQTISEKCNVPTSKTPTI